MATKKAGTVLVNKQNKKIALIYRKDGIGVEFPKGHLKEGETIENCAVRETEEETGRKNHLVDKKGLGIIKYITSSGEDVELYMYLAVDDGPVERKIEEVDKEECGWFDIDDIEKTLNYRDTIEFWNIVKPIVEEFLGGKNGQY